MSLDTLSSYGGAVWGVLEPSTEEEVSGWGWASRVPAQFVLPDLLRFK